MRFLGLLFILSIVFADYGGGYAGSGFRYGSNAREFALAGALVADRTPGFYVFSNPALLQFSIYNNLGISFQKMSLDRYIHSISYTRQLPPKAGVGLAVLKAGTDNIQGRNGMNEKTVSFSAHEIEGIISFGVAFNSKLALGMNLKTIFATIDENYNGRGIAGDIGFIIKLNRHLLLGGIMKNLYAGYNWKVIFGEDERSYEEKIPKNYSVGIFYSGLQLISFFLQEDIIITPGKDVNYRTRFAVEFHLSNNIELRGGIKQAWGAKPYGRKINKFNIKPTIGAGLPINVWQKQYIKLNYALDPGIEGEGLSHLFSFSLQF